MELKNNGAEPFNLGGWSVFSQDTFAEVYFPAGTTLAPGAFCRIYTNEIHPDSCGGVSFGMTEEAWLNDAGCGDLYNPQEEAVASYCY